MTATGQRVMLFPRLSVWSAVKGHLLGDRRYVLNFPLNKYLVSRSAVGVLIPPPDGTLVTEVSSKSCDGLKFINKIRRMRSIVSRHERTYFINEIWVNSSSAKVVDTLSTQT